MLSLAEGLHRYSLHGEPPTSTGLYGSHSAERTGEARRAARSTSCTGSDGVLVCHVQPHRACVDALAPEREALRDAFHPVRPAMALEYRERSTLGTGWALEVCSSGVLVGHIQFGAGNLSGTTKARRELDSRRC